MADKITAHAWSIEQAAKELGTDLTNGLTSAEARSRLERNGPNELKEKPRPGFFSLLFDQFKDFLIIILIAAAVLSVLLGEWIDAIVILAITGTDVTKQTADMVLTNDNFASIVSAIEEGRIICSNIRKFVFYLISCNIGEILIIFLAMLAGLPAPLSPVMLLFLNLVSDGAPALALGMEKGEPGIMDRPPRPVGEPIINREMQIGIAVQAVMMAIAVLGSYILSGAHPGASFDDPNLPIWRTVAFATLTLSELLRAFTARSERISVFKLGIFSNKTMNIAVVFSIVVVIAVIYVPFLQVIFGTVSLALVDWLWIMPFAVLASIAAEVTKIYLRARAKKLEIALTAQMELA
jgi:Ca2+-transporting ATPase